jgi:hypothetical protein
MDPSTRNAAPLQPSAAFGTAAEDATSGAALAQLQALVIKRGLRPGLLPAPERAAVLALVWAALPAAGTLREPEVNELLRAQLAGAVACLDIDHVELRRWLVDAGWLQRDGYGRAYWRTPAEALPDAGAAWGRYLQDLDPGAWVQALADAHLAAREARRQAWTAAQPSGDAGA